MISLDTNNFGVIGFLAGAASMCILIPILEKYDPFGLPFPFGKKKCNCTKWQEFEDLMKKDKIK